MKSAAKTLAIGSVLSAVKIDQIDPVMHPPRNIMRQLNNAWISDSFKPLNGNSKTKPKQNRLHATNEELIPCCVNNFPPTSPNGIKPIASNKIPMEDNVV